MIESCTVLRMNTVQSSTDREGREACVATLSREEEVGSVLSQRRASPFAQVSDKPVLKHHVCFWSSADAASGLAGFCSLGEKSPQMRFLTGLFSFSSLHSPPRSKNRIQSSRTADGVPPPFLSREGAPPAYHLGFGRKSPDHPTFLGFP